MRTLQQIGAVTALSIKSVPQRAGSSLVIVIGIAGVVAVLLTVLAMSASMIRTLDSVGQPDRAIVLRKNSDSESASSLSRDAIATIQAAPGIVRNAEGKPVASAEALTVVSLNMRDDDSRAEVSVRGVTPIAFDLRPEIKLVEGRHVRAGLQELIAGRTAQRQFKNLNVGDRVPIRNGDWLVVGVFESNRDARESELLADAETLLSAQQRNLFQAVSVRLESPAAFEGFKDSLTTNPTLSVDVKREPDYYQERSKDLGSILSIIAYVVGGIMAMGAMFGALNTMYSAVSARSTEIATLRALGFGPTGIVVSVLAEALLFAVLGALLGAAVAWLLFNGNTISTLQGGGKVVAQLDVDFGLIAVGILWAVAIGFLGGLFPAVRAARMPVAIALREI